jgi:hypothetical protein
VIVCDEVPAAAVRDERVWTDDALRLLARMGDVVEAESPPPMNCFREGECDVAVDRECLLRREGER